MAKIINLLQILFITTFIFISCSETKKQSDSEFISIGRQYRLAENLFEKAKYDSSNQILIPLSIEFLKDSSFENYVKSTTKISANFRKLGKYDSSFAYVKRAIEYSNKYLDSLNLTKADSYYLLGLIYKDYRMINESREALNKTLSIREKVLPQGDPLIGDVLNNLGAIIKDPNKYDDALNYYQTALKYRLKRGKFDKSVGSTYMNLGNLYYDLNMYKKSITNFSEALNIFKVVKGINHPLIGVLYLNMSNTYENQGKIDLSIRALNTAIGIFKKSFGEIHPYLAHAYNNLGLTYSHFGDNVNALNYFYKSLEIKQQLDANLVGAIRDNYLNIGESHYSLNEYDKAEEAFKSVLKLSNISKSEDIPDIISTRISLAQLYATTNKVKKAIEQVRVIKILFKKIPSSPRFPAFKAELSRVFLLLNRFDNAINLASEMENYYEKKSDLRWAIYCDAIITKANNSNGNYKKNIEILNNITDKLSSDSNSTKINLKRINATTTGNVNLIYILKEIGKSLAFLYDKKNEQKYLTQAQFVYESMMQIFEQHYQRLTLEQSKLEQSAELKNFLSKGLELAYNNFNKNPSKELFEYALTIAEFNKSMTLLEKIKKANAYKLMGLNKNDISKIKSLNRSIIYLGEKLSDYDLSKDDKKRLGKLLFDKRYEYNSFIDSLTASYPLLEQLTRPDVSVSVDSMRKTLLDKDQTAIEYYLYANELYVFGISQNDFFIIRKKVGNRLNSDITSLLSSINKVEKENYIRTANKVYNEIFAEADNRITTKRVLVIPDEELGYIPFDALLFELPNLNSDYRDLPYLLKKYSIGYAYSFNILGKSEKGDNVISKFLGIAPFSK